jgi:putative two-component system response regulator
LSSNTPEAGDSPTILIIANIAGDISLLSILLKDRYRIRVASSGAQALQIAAAPPCPDLILLAVGLPGMDGHDICRRLKASAQTADIPVIFLAENSQPQEEETGLQLGAADYLSRPVSPPLALARIATHLQLRQARRMLAEQHSRLDHVAAERVAQLSRMQDATILAMASLAETRDNETGNHLRRTQHYVAALARHLRAHPRFAEVLTADNIDLLFKSAPLHDIGKVGVADRVLLKPGTLDAKEFDEMKLHPVVGRDTIAAVEAYLGGSDGFLQFAREIAYSHQEKWDGSGYPEGLRGDDIPVSARLMAVADVYDALISKRVYKPALSHEEALNIMRDGCGTHFDPDVFDAFMQIEAEFRDIARRFQDAGMLFAEAKPAA